jgi:5-(carboxyamino)imidazole ribonucleotide synthase
VNPILPGAVLGILGGGQLGRMTAMAARSAGYHIHVLDPDPRCAAAFLSDRVVTAAFDDALAAADLARNCDAVTLEIEKIAIPALEAAARHAPTRPGAHVLQVVQDRIHQKQWLQQNGFPVGPWQPAASQEELAAAVAALGSACFIKVSRGGYDGRGQLVVTPAQSLPAGAHALLGREACAVEQALDLELEISVLVARRPGGETAVYPPALNHHENQILAWSVLPAPIPPALAQQAQQLAEAIAAALRVEGLLTVEMFCLRDGRLLVNELAPRPHNSYHASERACVTSQFEQVVRAVCDLPLGAVDIIRPAAIMNLLGDLWHGPAPPPFHEALRTPGVRLHLYGKGEPRPARKMGHLSALGATPDEALERVQAAMRALSPAPVSNR